MTAEDGGRLPGTTQVMSPDFKMTGTWGLSARTIVPYSLSGPYPPRRSLSYHSKTEGLSAIVRPILPQRPTHWIIANSRVNLPRNPRDQSYSAGIFAMDSDQGKSDREVGFMILGTHPV